MARLLPVPDRPARALGVIRVSKAKGREDLVSPEIQRASITDYAAQRGYTISRWVEVLDESASNDRSRWWKTLDACTQDIIDGNADVLLVWKFSRAARHRRRWAVALDRIEVAGGRIESATEGVDSTTSTGRLARGMLAELAAWEAEQKGEMWKEAHARRLRHGLPHTGRPRFGYLYQRTPGQEAQYLPDQATAPVLKECYKKFIAGASLRDIGKWLNEQGFRTPGGALWLNGSAIGRTLDSGFAAGLIPSGGRPVNGRAVPRTWEPGGQQPIITPRMWEQYRQVRQQQQNVPPRDRQRRYILTGLMYCWCGARAHLATKDHGHRQYNCSAQRNTQTCPGIYILAGVAERAVKQWCSEQDVLQKVPPEAAAIARKTARKTDRELLARAVLDADKAIDRLGLNQARSPLPDAVYDRLMGTLIIDREQAQQALDNTKDAQVAAAVRFGPIVEQWDRLRPEELNVFLQAVLTRVEIHRDEPRVRPVPRWAVRQGG